MKRWRRRAGLPALRAAIRSGQGVSTRTIVGFGIPLEPL